jgi:DNA-damage-inducible protein D
MSNSNIVPKTQHITPESPFDSIRRYSQEGKEYWLARELMKMLGYKTWQKFCDAIDRAKSTCLLNEEPEASHINHLPGSVSGSGRTGDDYRLSRKACYWVAMTGDTRKPEIALAHQYFAIKTREAEVIIPAQNDRIRELELEVRALELRGKENDRQDFRIAAHGIATTLLLEGKADSVVEIDRPILEVIDQQTGVKFSGQTTKQLADYLNKNGGRSFKSGAELERELSRIGRGDLIDTVPRKALQPFVSKENLGEACRVLISNRQQQLI